MSFLRQVRGELRKLVNPITVGLLVVFIAFFWQDLSRTTFLAEDQAGTAVFSHLVQQQQTAATCAPGAAGSAVECHLARMDEVNSRWFATNSVELGRIGRSLGTLPGLATFPSRTSSRLGWAGSSSRCSWRSTSPEKNRRGTVAASVLGAGRSGYPGEGGEPGGRGSGRLSPCRSWRCSRSDRRTPSIRPCPSTCGLTDNGWVPTGARALAPDATWSSAEVTPGPQCGTRWWCSRPWRWASWCRAFSLFRRPLPAALAGAGVIAVFFAIAEWGHRSSWGPMGGTVADPRPRPRALRDRRRPIVEHRGPGPSKHPFTPALWS